MIARTPEEFRESGVEIYTKHEVIDVDFLNKKIKVKNIVTNEILEDSYDKLMIASGARAIIPPIKNIDLEFIPLLYSYIIATIQNIDLLQFFVVTTGYSILLYLLYDYRKITNISFIPFLGIVLFTIFGFHALYFISGLYFYIAIIIFTLAFYYNYIKKGNTIIVYILYFISLFIHNAMFFPIAILIIYKIFKNQFNAKSILVCIFIFGLAGYILNFISSTIDIHILNSLTDTYNAYIKSDDQMHKYYSGNALYIEITKLIITILCILIQKERKKTSEINGFILLLSISTLIMIPQSIVMVRFIMLIQFIGIVPMIDCLKNLTKNKLILLFIILALSSIYIYYFYHILSPENFGNFFTEKIYDNIFSIFTK
ncbi:MAG: hypothetical protein HFH45_03935 [Bacilli bacterium]|nr:hypothetical protein [Bacilli bacterium]